MNQSTIDALRRLAERPGTEHEGAVAREMLRRAEAKLREAGDTQAVGEEDLMDLYRRYMRREMSVDAFVEAPRISTWKCPCGTKVRNGEKCANWQRHLEINIEIRNRFAKGDRVLYNYHAYPPDCPGRVSAHVKLKPENGTYPWAWISVKFDHLKGARQIPIIGENGEWCLKHDERAMVEEWLGLTVEQAAQLYRNAGRSVPQELQGEAEIKRHKYGAREKRVDGIVFKSTLEAEAYVLLKFWEQAGIIRNLELQPRFVLQEKLPIPPSPLQTKSGRKYVRKMQLKIAYVADFRFLIDCGPDGWRERVVDAKGKVTPVFAIKEKMFRARYPDVDLQLWDKRKVRELSRA